MAPVALVVKWVALPSKQEEVIHILRVMTTLTRREPGCLSYQVYRSLDDPHEFTLVEVYVDQDAVIAHGETDYFKDYVIGRAIPALKARQRSLYSVLE